jgi:hypothetical protein
MDATGFNWRAAGITLRLGFFPAECCHWGIYDDKTSTLYIGPTAFANTQRLEYVVRHELGHGWQYHSGHMQQLLQDLAPWGHTGRDGIETGADCIASVWGATMWNYWSCPADAKALMARRLAGDWS